MKNDSVVVKDYFVMEYLVDGVVVGGDDGSGFLDGEGTQRVLKVEE